MGKPRLLDLFCGAGGAAMGYARAGFEVVGVDHVAQPHYPFSFWQYDALSFLTDGYLQRWVREFDAIHASPPCQAYTTMNNRHGSSSPLLIAEVRQLLDDIELPYVIENVRGALSEMRSPLELAGEMFGLRVHRPRLFESNILLMGPGQKSARQLDPVAVYGKEDGRLLWRRADGTELHAANLEDGSSAMGIDWMTWDELREAIPPAYTEYIGRQLMAVLPAYEENGMKK